MRSATGTPLGTSSSQAIEADGLTDMEILCCENGYLAALRGDAATAEALTWLD